jgi:type VI protein secretion system component Hcp
MVRTTPLPMPIALLLAAAALIAAPEARAQTENYLYLQGVPGESVHPDHMRWTVVSLIRWPTGEIPTSGPGIVRVAKRPDMGSPYIKMACFDNTLYREVVLSIRQRRGRAPATTQRIVLRNVRLSDCQSATRVTPTETMTLNFTEIEVIDDPPALYRRRGGT